MGKRAQAGVAEPAGKVGKTQRGADFPEAAAHLAEIHQAVQQIAKHPVLQDILTAEPVEFGARDKWGNVGNKHPFNVQQYRNAMMSQGAAEFAGNFFWCNPCWLALHGVPPNKRQLLEISDTNSGRIPRLHHTGCPGQALPRRSETCGLVQASHARGGRSRVSPGSCSRCSRC